MGINELLLFVTAILSASIVFFAWRMSKERLYSAIIVFLILIGTLGGKLVEFFGHTTNTGNIFYASVYLATYFLIERFGKREGVRSVWIGVGAVILYFILAQMTVDLAGNQSSGSFNGALSIIFNLSSRITFASIIAYAVSQTLNVYLYITLKRRLNDTRLWLRVNISNAFAQTVDSVVFFSIAFWGVVPPGNIGDVIMTGFVIKVVYMMLASPLLYLNNVEEDEGRGYSSIILR
jgi:uncharacterized integral membrane protein (TIGR00697 family)